MGTENKHMLSEPAFFGGPVDGQAQRQFLQANCVTAILSIDAIDQVFFEVDINPAFVNIFTHSVFAVRHPVDKLTFGMDESEKLGRGAEFLKLLVAGPVENGFAVGNVGRVRYLNAGNREI